MQTPEQVAEFLSWIESLIQFALAVGLFPSQVAVALILLHHALTTGLAEALRQIVAGVMLVALLVVGIGGLLFFGFIVVLIAVLCRSPSAE